MKNWTQDQTEKWLTENPLPPDFEWRGRIVLPTYRLHKGYGFWLRETPYHRGLFAEVHGVLFRKAMQDLDFPDVVELSETLRAIEAQERAQMSLFDDHETTDHGTK